MMTITSHEQMREGPKQKCPVTHSGDELNKKSWKRRVMGRPVRRPESVTKRKWYALLCKLLDHACGSVCLRWCIGSLRDEIELRNAPM